MRPTTRMASARRPMGGRSSWMKWASCRSMFRRSLLRFLETHEFFPLGASKPRRVNVRVCCATHRDLREGIAAGTFREDFYYRLTKCSKRDSRRSASASKRFRGSFITRVAGIRAWAIEVHASFVAACISGRPWPGNVRELLGAVRRGLHAAREGKLLSVEHLDKSAGIQASISSPPLRAPSLHEERGSQSNIRATRASGPALRGSDSGLGEGAHD